MFTCNVNYGVDTEPFQSETPIRVSQIKRDMDLRNSLGFGDNVNVMVNGVTLPDDAIVPNGSTVVLETAANKKAMPELVAA